MNLFSKIFRSPVKEWEREYVERGRRKVKDKPVETPAKLELEVEDEEADPGFKSRFLGPSLKPWEQEYADGGVARKVKHDLPEGAGHAEPEATGKLQKALRMIAQENREVPDMFRKKAKPLESPELPGKPETSKKKDAGRRKGPYLPPASMPDIDGAVTSAMAEIGAASSEQIAEVVLAAQARLKGKTVDPKILNERVRAKLA